MPVANEINSPFDQLVGQPLAAAYLSAAVQARYLAQAYLFIGPLGAGKAQAASLFARSLLCPNQGDDDCEACRLVTSQSHPDLKTLAPEGAGAYLAAQMHDLIREATLAPILSSRKVYIVSQSDRMSTHFANAFLRLLEEPPRNVVFILLAQSLTAILPTIQSRCQLVPFAAVPESIGISLLVDECAIDIDAARAALAYSAGSVADARDLVLSTNLNALKRELTDCLRGLVSYDALDVLEAARSLVIACKLPLDELRADQERRLEEGRELLSRSALNNLEQRLKREMTAAERGSVVWVIHAIRIWLRDVLLYVTARADEIVNTDQRDLVALYASSLKTPLGSVLRCLDATLEADLNLDYNVSVQSIFEFLLFTIRAELGEQ